MSAGTLGTSGSDSVTRFEALGTTAVIAVTDPVALAAATDVVARIVNEFDLACSRFRADSELSAVNAAAGTPVPVSPLLLGAVQAALRAARLTDGDVDPTIGRAIIALGYDRDFSSLPKPAPAPTLRAAPGWRTVAADADAGTVKVDRGVSLDLGATAKALAADRAAAAAYDAVGGGVLVSLGGDLAIAGPPPHDGWRVRVTDDHRAGPEAPGQWITLRSGALATSSTTVRRWAGGRHHLIDPASGHPTTTVWRTVSVAAASCLDANIASTAAVIRGERAIEWLTELRLSSRLVAVDGTARHIAGWPADGEELPS
jgi:thiamine biosynthesis lipoprotein